MFTKTKKELALMGLSENGNRFYGALKGYETNATIDMYGLQLHVSMYKTQSQLDSMESDLQKIKTRFINWQWTDYGIEMSLTDWTENAFNKKFSGLIESIYGIFAANGALGVGYCPVCGQPLDLENAKKCIVDGSSISLDNDCVDRINTIITTENKEFDAAPNNYLKGFCGALIGGVAGAIVAIVLSYLGIIAAISSFISFFVGVLLYQKFGGKPNKMMIVIVTATTFVCMILSVVGIYVFIVAQQLAEEGIEMGAFEAFSILIQNSEEFARAFYSDLALTVLFTIVGCVYEIIQTARKIKRQKNI